MRRVSQAVTALLRERSLARRPWHAALLTEAPRRSTAPRSAVRGLTARKLS